MNIELSHSGVKGMKWGIRKKIYTEKNARRDARRVQQAQKMMDKRRLGDLKANGKTIVNLNKTLGKGYALTTALSTVAAVGMGVASAKLINSYNHNYDVRNALNHIFGHDTKFIIGATSVGATAALGSWGAAHGGAAAKGLIMSSKIKKGLEAQKRLEQHGYS